MDEIWKKKMDIAVHNHDLRLDDHDARHDKSDLRQDKSEAILANTVLMVDLHEKTYAATAKMAVNIEEGLDVIKSLAKAFRWLVILSTWTLKIGIGITIIWNGAIIAWAAIKALCAKLLVILS